MCLCVVCYCERQKGERGGGGEIVESRNKSEKENGFCVSRNDRLPVLSEVVYIVLQNLYDQLLQMLCDSVFRGMYHILLIRNLYLHDLRDTAMLC
jgi:hypothetical protein